MEEVSGHQIFQWLYRSRVKEIDEMSNLSKETRELLKENFLISPLTLREKQVARDGTTKYLFALSDGSLIESVLMQFDYGKSVCVTSQVGCNMGCAFCASGLTRKQRDLTSGEMVAQVLYIQQELDAKEERVSHIVVMGTGEPFDNYDNVMNFLGDRQPRSRTGHRGPSHHDLHLWDRSAHRRLCPRAHTVQSGDLPACAQR